MTEQKIEFASIGALMKWLADEDDSKRIWVDMSMYSRFQEVRDIVDKKMKLWEAQKDLICKSINTLTTLLAAINETLDVEDIIDRSSVEFIKAHLLLLLDGWYEEDERLTAVFEDYRADLARGRIRLNSRD